MNTYENTTIPSLQEVEKRPRLKLFGFGLLGFFGVGVAILATAWILFKTKFNKKQKYIAVAVGLVASLVFSFGAQVYIKTSNPEIKTAVKSIEKQYPNGSVKVGMGWSKVYRDGISTTYKSVTIQYKSRDQIGGEQLMNIGRLTCSALSEKANEYSSIEVVNNPSPIYPFSIPFVNYYYNASGSCENWLNDEQFEQMITNMPPLF